jgi:hypothetical protein
MFSDDKVQSWYKHFFYYTGKGMQCPTIRSSEIFQKYWLTFPYNVDSDTAKTGTAVCLMYKSVKLPKVFF